MTKVKEIPLSPDNKKKLIDFYSKVFKKTPLSYFEKRLSYDPYLKNGMVSIVKEGEKIVSSIILYPRKIYINGKEVKIGGIGNVATLESERGKGFSSLIMKKIIDSAKKNDYKYLLLFTDINSFYKRFGFITIDTYNAILKVKKTSPSQFIIREFNKEDQNQITKIYTFFNKRLNGPIVRKKKYWEANLNFSESEEIFLVAEKNKKIEAYLRAVPDSQKGDIWEFGYYKKEAFENLIIYLSDKIKRKNLTTAALVQKNLFPTSSVYTVQYQKTTIAMALRLNEKVESLEYNFNFWWTDNF